jgi:hypothetical protein
MREWGERRERREKAFDKEEGETIFFQKKIKLADEC